MKIVSVKRVVWDDKNLKAHGMRITIPSALLS